MQVLSACVSFNTPPPPCLFSLPVYHSEMMHVPWYLFATRLHFHKDMRTFNILKTLETWLMRTAEIQNSSAAICVLQGFLHVFQLLHVVGVVLTIVGKEVHLLQILCHLVSLLRHLVASPGTTSDSNGNTRMPWKHICHVLNCFASPVTHGKAGNVVNPKNNSPQHQKCKTCVVQTLENWGL